MSFFGIAKAAARAAAGSKTVRSVAAKSVRRGNSGFLSNVFATSGKVARQAKKPR